MSLILHRFSRAATVGTLLSAVALSGCKVGPNYKAPAMPAPPAYSEEGHNGDWKDAAPSDGLDRGEWWAVYNDPSLNELEVRCAKSNASLEAALHAYEQAHDIVREVHSNLYPTVGVGLSGSRNKTSYNKPLRSNTTPTNYWDFLIPLTISWEPDLWGGVRRQIESAGASAQASAADLADARLSLQGSLAVTYLQIHGIDLQAQLLQSTLDAYTESLKFTSSRFKGGLASESDVAQAQAQLEETRSQLIDLGEERAQLEHAIAVLVGEPATNFHIDVKPLAGDPPSIPTGVPSQLLERRPDIAAAERRVAAANALIGVAKAAYYPNVTLGASGGIESDRVGQVFSSRSAEWFAGPSVNETLFDAGRRKAQVDAAIAQRAQAAALYREQVLSAFRDVEDQLASLRVLDDEATVTARAVAAAKRSTELSNLRYKRGLAAYIEVLTNQTIELTDERQAAALVSRRIIASAQLQMALGGGWNAQQLPKN
jgi:NodT family efflux transporter outer membrane factor (OMF) lipoprotein